MAKIQSDASVASTCATAIQSGASGITAVGAPTKDSNSDYSGNSDASTYIDGEASSSSQIAEKINEFIALIHSTVNEFEAIDQKLAKRLRQILNIQCLVMTALLYQIRILSLNMVCFNR